MEEQSGHDPENDGSASPQPSEAAPGPAAPGFPADPASPDPASPDPAVPGPDDAASPGPPGSGSGSGPGADPDTGGDGESVFGPWDALEGTLGAAKERAELLSGFAAGGVWDKHPPGPELAAAVAKAAGPDFRCASATGEERIGLLRAMAALQSWAGAGMLGVIRGLIRDDDQPYLGRSKHGDLPDGWDDSLLAEISLALAVSLPSAEKTTRAAWELGARLPGVELLLRDGTLDVPRARLITEVFAELSDEDAARAEELLLPELTAPPRKTYTQIERIATAIAAAVDPGLAERRRESAEKHRARVAMFREQSGAAALSGRDLPVDEALAAYANLDARAKQYKDSGAFPGERLDRLRAAAYLDILNGVSADARIACGHLGSDAARKADPEPAPETNAGDDADGPGDEGLAGGPGSGGSDCPCDECDGRCAPPDDSGFPDDDEPDDSFPHDGDPDDNGPDDGQSDDNGPDDGQPDGGGPDDRGTDARHDGGPDDSGPDDSGPDDSGPGDGSPRGPGYGGGPGRGGPRGGSEPPTADGPGHHAGPGPGPNPAAPALRSPSLEPARQPAADPGRPDPPARHPSRPRRTPRRGTQPRHASTPPSARTLAAIATLSPHTTVCITVTDPDGIAIGHGCAKPSRSGRPGTLPRPPGGPPPPLVALPARINLTITAASLAQLCAQPDTGPPGPEGTGWSLARSGAGPPVGSAARPRGTTLARSPQRPPGDPDWCGPWTLTLPTGPQYIVNLEPVPTYGCDHRNESHAYKPNDTLRHLVQIRDYTCTFPPCSRHARDSDFEHATPYDQGGRTCACNAGARSRKCHRVKQAPGWTVTQPRPGWHQWQTPRGRTYTQGPKHYPV